MPSPQVERSTLLEQPLVPLLQTAAVEIRRITMGPNVAAGPHRHNGPVFGSIERGSVVFAVRGQHDRILRPGDVFYEPAEVVIDRFDATDEGVVFFGYFLLGPGESPQISMGA